MKQLLQLALILPAMLLLSQQLYAQGMVKGTATDENGEPLIGATVLLVGTSTGTATDFDGNYELNVPAGNQRLQVSYTGYDDKVQAVSVVDGQTVTLNFSLGEDVEILDEVVVIGYGAVRKEDLTGVVAKVETKDFNGGAIVSPEQLITGKVAGVQISPGDGSPGGGSAIRIRGNTSINASNEPLYVIDGMPIDNEGFAGGRNPLNFLNPSDIASFTVLKDASATAIYGSRGANGVIVITTKQGQAGDRPRVTYDGYYTVSEIRGEPNILNGRQFREVVTFARPNNLDLLGDANTNWFDESLRRAQGQSHNINFTGGGDNFGYRIGAGFQDLEGIVRGSSTERINFSLGYNHQLFDGKLLVNTNIRGARTRDEFDDGIGNAWAFDPTQPVLDPDNKQFGGFFAFPNGLAPRNPAAQIALKNDEGKTFRTLGNIDLEYKLDFILPGLSIKTNAGFDVNQGQRNIFEPSTLTNTVVASNDGYFKIENYTRTNYLLDAYLKLERQLSEQHRINLSAGYSYQDFREEYPVLEGVGTTTDQFGTNAPEQFELLFPSNSIIENRLISFWGRAIYNFDERYILTATVRRDGSTRFGPENRWGIFPSAALAWRIIEEDFAEGLSNVFSDLKLRLSYGAVGNQDFDDYLYLPRYRLSDQQARYQIGVDEDGNPIFVNTARPAPYDAGLQWESTVSLNAGLEFGFANGRVTGALEVYQQNTNELIFGVAVPSGTNLSDRVTTNIGEIQNSGVELSLTTTAFNTPDVSWSLSGNAAYNRSEVVDVSVIGGGAGILRGGIDGGVGNNVSIIQEGEEIDAFYLYEHILDENGNPVYSEGEDLAMYVDQNGDGQINEADRTTLGAPLPDILLGLTSNLTAYNFDLSFTLRGAIGNQVYNNNASNLGHFSRLNGNNGFVNNLHASVLETRFDQPQYFSDYYLEDASFLRVDNISLGYTFEPSRTVSSLRLYTTVQNPFVFTNYSGLDPEVGIGGIDRTPYPRPIAFLFGLNLTL